MALSASSRGSSSWFSFYPPCELGHDPSPVLECCWLAAAGDSDDAELDEIGRELEADLNFRDRMDTEANQLEEQGEFGLRPLASGGGRQSNNVDTPRGGGLTPLAFSSTL